MDKKRAAIGGEPKAAGDEQQRAAVLIISLPESLADCKTSVLFANRARLEHIMRTTDDNETWATALVAWGEINLALLMRGHRFKLPDPARDGWTVPR